MVGMKPFVMNRFNRSTLNVLVIEVLIGSYHNIPVEGWQFAQNGFISIDWELFISIGSSIHLSYDKFVHAMSNFSKYCLQIRGFDLLWDQYV